jgi:hypothetical protein
MTPSFSRIRASTEPGAVQGVTVDAYGGCFVSHFGPDVYRVGYDGETADTIELHGEAR